MAELVQILQLISGLMWTVPAAFLAPGVWRTIRGNPTVLDLLSAPVFFVCCIFIAGAVRWLAWNSTIRVMGSEELTFWAGIYVVSAFCSVGVLWSYLLARGR